MAKRSPAIWAVVICLWMTSACVFAAGSVSSSAIKVVPIMDQGKLQALYPDPYVVGEMDAAWPLWPLQKQEVTGLNLVGYLYESINYSSIPGFMGIPYNLLVALDTEGGFVDVQVLFHREPMFVGGIGEQPMFDFVEQYKGLSLMQNIKFTDKHGQKKASDSKNIYLDGISGATASIRILNQTLLSSALKVARAKLGFGAGKDPDLIAKIDADLYQALNWHQLIERGLIKKVVLSHQDAEALFTGRPAKEPDPTVAELGDEYAVELYLANIAIPSVGKNLLPPHAWSFLQENLDFGDHALLVVSSGQHSFMHEKTLRGGISDRLLLRQEGLPIEMRDLDMRDRLDKFQHDEKILLPLRLKEADWMIYRVIDTSGIDIALPLAFEFPLIRGDDIPYRPTITKNIDFDYVIPRDFYFEPDPDDKTWVSIWRDRAAELAILGVGLVVLLLALSLPSRLTRMTRVFAYFRTSYLIFTLFFIGWYAQGQLSIVNITGVIQSLMAGGNLNFFLYDPMTTVLWLVLIPTFFLWGRGTFCGWLCPFGAMQELTSKTLSLFKLKPIEPSAQWDRRLKKLKYIILFCILVSAFFSATWTDRLVEIEPFKTSITFYFERYWPFAVWAVAMVLMSGLIYKGYCRYLCPLGAAMAVLGKLRWLDWIPRRSECGSPCQLCNKRCEYQAIEANGRIDYNECFQCLDCVVIYHSDHLCVPRIIENRSGRKLKTSASPKGV